MDQHEAPADSREPIEGVAAPDSGPSFRRPRTKRGTILLVSGLTALALGFSAVGIGFGITALNTLSAIQDRLDQSAPAYPANPGIDDGHGAGEGPGGLNPGSQGNGTSATLKATPATDAQKVGLVTIVSNLYYGGQARAAGTGMILTAGGEILTNNHVVQGATTIRVTVESSGASYTAKVLGTDPVDDIALLQLSGALALQTVSPDVAASVAVGQNATSIGNAEGTGNLVAATGPVSATNTSITVRDEVTGQPKSLNNVIEVAADIVSGDSGGPLVNSSGKVVGIVTAASTSTVDVTGYAIPISRALTIVAQIESGNASSNVQIGSTAFLGVEISDKQGTTGVTLSAAIPGKPGEAAGLIAGDIITSIDGVAVRTPAELTTAVTSHHVGDTIAVGYTSAKGTKHTVHATLVAGPVA